MQRRGTSGKTTASRLKTLHLHVQAAHGPADADALLLSTRLGREDLEDETRLVPVELWHSALVAFASRFGREAIENVVRAAVHPENLGVWTHVLRGAEEPRAAFRRLDHFGGEQVWTERWKTVADGPGYWRGSIRVSADSSIERDGLCALARAAELASVPLLFGLPQGVVVLEHGVASGAASVTQTYEVRWRAPSTLSVLAAGSGVGGVAGGLLTLLSVAQAPWPATVLIGAIASGAVATATVHEWRRRAQSRSQLTRIQALERGATLRETRERGAVGFHSGQVVAGQYRLTEKLGVGANGTIWEAERIADGDIVAVKLLRAAVAHDTVAADRLRREAAALGLAWHPNVVEVYDDGHLPDGTSYLVMERLYGESLAARLKQGAMSPAELLPVALEVCDALAAVHAAGVVHRDVKPSNIFLALDPSGVADPKNRKESAKILDFGVARVEWAETRLTNADAPLGTPGYMSPEQEQGQEVDARTDVYAVGAVICECLSGKPPPMRSREYFGEEGSAESGVLPALRAIPSHWRAIIERATATLPNDRYADTKALRDALCAMRDGERESA